MERKSKIEIPKWGAFSGYASYSYMVGNRASSRLTGGLFLGDDAIGARLQLSGHFPDSQDQRNTVRASSALPIQTPPVGCRIRTEYGSGTAVRVHGDLCKMRSRNTAQPW